MIDDEDDFDLSDAEAAREAMPLGLVVPSVNDMSLTDIEHKFRNAKAALPVLFTAAPEDETAPEVFDDPREDERFQRLMDWPRPPTVQEAEAFLAHRVTLAERAEWLRRYGTKPPK